MVYPSENKAEVISRYSEEKSFYRFYVKNATKDKITGYSRFGLATY